jgi:hypothetical protein
LWVYPATVLTALSLLVALHNANVPAERQGWWLIGLAAVYLLTAWVLRRIGLTAYGAVLIVMGFMLIALGLPPSSQNQIGAIRGYGAAALLYALCAFWLEQPLLLTLACVLIVVPYAGILQRSPIAPEYYGSWITVWVHGRDFPGISQVHGSSNLAKGSCIGGHFLCTLWDWG